jgi:hypothetical protein
MLPFVYAKTCVTDYIIFGSHKNDCSGTYEKTMKLEAPSQKKVAGGICPAFVCNMHLYL